MSATWPHTLRIYSGDVVTPGGYTDDDGIWHDDPAASDTVTLFDGPADVQDGGAMFNRDKSGEIVDRSDAVAFLKQAKVITSLSRKTGLKAEITWEDDSVSLADVVEVRRLDGSIWLKRVI